MDAGSRNAPRPGIVARLVGLVENGLLVLAGIALVAMMLLISVSALGRHFFSAPINGTEVVVGVFLAPLVTYFAAATALSHRQHVGVTALVSHLPRTVRRWSQIAAALLTVVIFGIVAYQGVVHAHTASVTDQIETETGIPLSWAYMTVPIGATAVCISALFLAIHWIRSGKSTMLLARPDESEEVPAADSDNGDDPQNGLGS